MSCLLLSRDITIGIPQGDVLYPRIDSLSVIVSPTGGNTQTVITGAGFTGATAITFGGVNATTYTVDSDTQITATIPALTAGNKDLVVTPDVAIGGPVTKTNAITVQAGASAPGAPTIALVESLTSSVELSIVPPEGYEAIDIYRDGVILPAGTDITNPVSFTDTTVAESTTYIYTAKARNQTGTSPASNAIETTTPTGIVGTKGRLESIEEAISDIIAGLRTTAGYHFNWGNSNVIDEAQKTYPCADVEMIDDTDVADINSAHSQLYTSEARFRIKISYRNNILSDSPKADTRKYQYSCIEDLKKAFGINYHLNDTANMCEYSSSIREELNNGSISMPSTIATELTVYYTQDRIYPHLQVN